MFERLLTLRNDVGLLAEEYDPVAGRQLGNFPQAFSHVGLVNSAFLLSDPGGPMQRRSRAGADGRLTVSAAADAQARTPITAPTDRAARRASWPQPPGGRAVPLPRGAP